MLCSGTGFIVCIISPSRQIHRPPYFGTSFRPLAKITSKLHNDLFHHMKAMHERAESSQPHPTLPPFLLYSNLIVHFSHF